MCAIYLSPYTKDWITEFEREKEILIRAIGEWVKDIQHIGSTAIPGICAKPIIDIMIGVKSLEEADFHCTPAIQKLGYEYIQRYESEFPERRYFQKCSSQNIRTHQIHLVRMNSEWWKRRIFFRDYLKSHPKARFEYETLKKELAQKCTDTNEYASAKTDFIRSIEAKMNPS